MTKALITPPALPPVTLDELKAHLRLETDTEDDHLEFLLAAAVAQVEAECGKHFIAQTWRIFLDDWPPDGLVELPVAPVRSIAQIRVYDEEGEPSVLSGGWTLDAVSDPPRLFLSAAATPGAPMNGIEIDVEAGFGETGADMPDALRRAVLLLAGLWYEQRGSAADMAAAGVVPAGFSRLLAPFRRPLL